MPSTGATRRSRRRQAGRACRAGARAGNSGSSCRPRWQAGQSVLLGPLATCAPARPALCPGTGPATPVGRPSSRVRLAARPLIVDQVQLLATLGARARHVASQVVAACPTGTPSPPGPPCPSSVPCPAPAHCVQENDSQEHDDGRRLHPCHRDTRPRRPIRRRRPRLKTDLQAHGRDEHGGDSGRGRDGHDRSQPECDLNKVDPSVSHAPTASDDSPVSSRCDRRARRTISVKTQHSTPVASIQARPVRRRVQSD